MPSKNLLTMIMSLRLFIVNPRVLSSMPPIMTPIGLICYLNKIVQTLEKTMALFTKCDAQLRWVVSKRVTKANYKYIQWCSIEISQTRIVIYLVNELPLGRIFRHSKYCYDLEQL